MPWLGEQSLQAWLRRLAVSLEAQVVNGAVAGRDTSPAAKTIFSGQVRDVSDPFIIVDEELPAGEAEAPSQHIYALWRLPVLLARPHVRPHDSSVVLTASASLMPELAVDLNARGSGYLQSGLPTSLNLLESLAADPALGGVRPRLSALRVSRVAPLMRKQDLAVHIRSLAQLRLPVFPAAHARIRFTRPNTAPPGPAIVALLEIDFTPHLDGEALLDGVELLTPDATVESLGDAAAMGLPQTYRAHDHVTFLYLIRPHEPEAGQRPVSGNLDISVSACLCIAPGVCAPRLAMAWSAALDFTTPVNPSFAGALADAGIQRAHHPSQLSIGGVSPATPTPVHAPLPDALPATDHRPSDAAALADLGITMSFTGPAGPVRPGDVFSWTVYVVNRSGDKSPRPPRKLALVAVPRRRRNDVRPLRPPSTASRRPGEQEIADAVLDDNALHLMQRSSAIDASDVLCLSADTRVGPLGPGACHVVDMQFLALREGVVEIEAIRVVDLSSQEHVEIRDLPTVLVEPAAA